MAPGETASATAPSRSLLGGSGGPRDPRDGDGGLDDGVAGRPTRLPQFPSIAVKRGGAATFEKVFVVWAEVNFTENDRFPECSDTCGEGEQADVDIYFMRLTSSLVDGTITKDFADPRVIARDPPGQGQYRCADQWFPWMTVDGNGRLHVVFFDNRNTPDDAEPSECQEGVPPSQRRDDSCAMTHDLYHTYSDDNGDTWSSPQRITTEQEGGSSLLMTTSANGDYFIGDYIGVSASLDPAQPIVVNAALNRCLGSAGDQYDQEIYAAKIVPAP